MDKHDQGGEYHGVYFKGNLIHTLCDGVELKPYTIWMKVNQNDARQEPCSPYWTIKDLMLKMDVEVTEYVVTLGNTTISPLSLTTIKTFVTSEEKPLWFFSITSPDLKALKGYASCHHTKTLTPM